MDKPKVRFSHNSENAVGKAIPKTVTSTQEKGKVKVKSIVPINLPVKVLKNGKRLLLKDYENPNDEEITEHILNDNFDIQHTNNRMHYPKSHISSSSTCFTKTNDKCAEMDPKQFGISRSETSISETPVNYIHLSQDKLDPSNKNNLEVQNCLEKLQGVNIAKNDDKLLASPPLKTNRLHQKLCHENGIISIEKKVQYINCDSSDSNDDIEVVKVVENFPKSKIQQGSTNNKKAENQVRNITSVTQREDKENNDGSNDFHKTFRKVKSSTNTNILREATLSRNKNVKINVKNPVKIQRKLQVMPCAKFKPAPPVNSKYTEKQVKTQVKTRSVFNFASKASNILVCPGMSGAAQNDHSKCHVKEPYKKKDITSANLLSRPEYNSTVSVMKQLKEVAEEKVIKGIESLPATYKSFVNGKISAALDFAPYESVYKNLINLSIDDNELPARLTRTKDPEPRNKDIVPSLHMFFKPKCTQEHFVSLDPQIFDPISVDTLNAFTISNKVCTWRISRESF